MRSRYSAFALGNSDYLQSTWHADYRPSDITLDSRVRWLGLEILSQSQAGDEATVEFEACLLCDGRVESLHEESRFVRIDRRWFYTKGRLLESRFDPWKPGRNEACPCGSALKFKRCCGK